MKAWTTISRTLVALALFGLALGPSAASSAGSAITQQEMSAMADDMPCCPDEELPTPDCSKDCPLAIICAPVLLTIPAAKVGTLHLREPLVDRFLNRSDAALASIAGEPSPRPPKA